MKIKFRLLPVMIFCAALTLTLKLGGLWQGLDGIITPSLAAEHQDGDKSGGKKDAKAEAGKTDKSGLAAKSDETGADRKKAKSKKSSKKWFDPAVVTDAELQILQNLSERRKQIEKQERSLDMRSGLLKVTEQRIDTKIAEIKIIQATIAGLIKKHNKQTDMKMKSVVKIYENMKPKDAARIFEQLDMAILLDVVERMRETKTAPIMARMSPQKAKAVTVALAHRRALPVPEKPDRN